MTTTAQQIYVRARQSSPANAGLAPTPAEVLARIESDQQALFASIAGITRDRFQLAVTITSTAGVQARVFDLSTLSPTVERVLSVTLSDGREAHQVDVLDIDAELAPRYIVRGKTLVEVSNEWSAANGAVTATLVYVFGPTAISPSTDFTQLVSVPDEWVDLLVLPLAMYFYDQRPADARNPDELGRLQQRLSDKTSAFLASLQNFGGVESQRFILPTPMTDSGKK